MAGNTVTLTFIGDDKNLARSLRSVGDAADESKRRFHGFSTGVTTAAAGVGLALVAMGRSAADAAAEQEQAFGGLESVFKENAGQVKDWAADAAKAVGLSKTQFASLAAPIGASLKGMGFSLDQSTAKTGDLIKIGADLAATFGGDVSDAVSAIGSLLRGERDPIERYGVSIKEVDINARLAAKGLSGLTGQELENAKATAALELLMEGTADSVGQFARESDTAAGSAAIQKAEWENLRAELGEQLLPVMQTVTGLLSKFTDWASEHKGTVTAMALAVGGLSAAVLLTNGAVAVANTVVTIWHGIVRTATAVQWLWNAAMYATPVGLVILGVVALIAVIGLLIWKWDDLIAVGRRFAAEAPGWFTGILGAAISVFNAVYRVIAAAIEGWKRLLDGFANVWNSTIGALGAPKLPSVSLSGAGSKAGGSLPKKHGGGVVPGRIGSEVLAVLQAGEEVIPIGSDGKGGGSMVVTFGGNTDGAFATAFMNLVRAGAIQFQGA